MPAERMVPPLVWLSSLFFASLVLFTDDYVIAGILPELARDLLIGEWNGEVHQLDPEPPALGDIRREHPGPDHESG